LENPADFPKPVFIWRGSCFNTPQLIYINVGCNLKNRALIEVLAKRLNTNTTNQPKKDVLIKNLTSDF